MPRRKNAENGSIPVANSTSATTNVNASTNASSVPKATRTRRTKKDLHNNAANMEPKIEMGSNQAIYDNQSSIMHNGITAPQAMQMNIHDENGATMPNHHIYHHHPHQHHHGLPTPSHSHSIPTQAPHPHQVNNLMNLPSHQAGQQPQQPPPEYYHQGIPPGYQHQQPQSNGPVAPQFMESDQPNSPYIGQPSHLPPPPQHNHVIVRYRHAAPMGPPGHHQGHMPAPNMASLQLECRLHEMNRRLFIFSNSGIQERDYTQWWDAYAHEFFDDDAKMNFLIFDEQGSGHHKFSIGRMLIPRYYRSIFDSGVKEMFYVVRMPSREHASGVWTVYLECENLLLVSKHEKPVPSEVHTDCKLLAEFVFDETYGYRIRQWNIEFRHCQEFVLRDISMLQDSETQEKLKLSITRSGMTQITLNYLKLCAILEPMQILMSSSKWNNLPPRETLKQTLFQAHAKYQQFHNQQQQQQMAMNSMGGMNAPHVMSQPLIEEATPKKTRKRTRKAAVGNTTATGGTKKKNSSPAATNAPNFSMNSHFPMQYQDLMVVGEPSMMGGVEYGDEDERTISRVENTQFDPNAMHNQMPSMNQPMSATPMSMGGPPPVYMNDFELSAMGSWGGVVGSNQPSGTVLSLSNASLVNSNSITSCEPQT